MPTDLQLIVAEATAPSAGEGQMMQGIVIAFVGLVIVFVALLLIWLFIAATCTEKGIRFLKRDAEIGVRKIDKQAAATGASVAPTTVTRGTAATKPTVPAKFTVSVDGKCVFMAFDEIVVTVDGRIFRVAIKPQATSLPTPASEPGGGHVTEFKSQMPGAVCKVLVKPGTAVRTGEAILILEAMKMEMDIPAPVG